MKKLLITILSTIFGCGIAFGAEALHSTTDKTAYIAGERMWISSFCGADSFVGSRTGYVEIVGEGGDVEAFCKISLDSRGRGLGYIDIPSELPSGYYSLVSYTLMPGCTPTLRPLAIYNTLSSVRLPGCKSVLEAEDPLKLSDDSRISVAIEGGIAHVSIDGIENGSIGSVSVSSDDSLGADSCLETLLPPMEGDFKGEFEGETIRLRFNCSAGISKMVGLKVRLSFMGLDTYIFSSVIDSDGCANFYTGNIIGRQEMFCEIEGLPEGISWSYSLERKSPAVRSTSLPELHIAESMKDALKARSLSMQAHRIFDSDSLYELAPECRSNTFLTCPDYVYALDDYKRFPTMKETLQELIPILAIRNGVISLKLDDILNSKIITMSKKVFVIVDGVPVEDHAAVLAIDPSLISKIEVFTRTAVCGSLTLEGVIKLSSFKGNLAGARLGENVLSTTFHGCSYPLSAKGAALLMTVPENYPDLRSTIYWDGNADLSSGYECDIRLPMNASEVGYKVVVSVFGADGEVTTLVKRF